MAPSALPVPRPLAEVVEVPLPKRSGALRPLAHFLVHHARVLGYLPLLVYMLARRTRGTAAGLAVYLGVLRRMKVWNHTVHRAIAYGSSNKPRWFHAFRKPYDPSKTYLMTTHPHGILCCGVFNACARAEPEFKNTGVCQSILPGLRFTLCFAPAVQWYPLHGEMYGKYCTDASAATVKKVLDSGMSAAICPGGFSEAVYTGASRDYDHAYLDGRMGFIKVAIEKGVDIAPMYTFGMYDMYETVDGHRHKRSVMAQNSGLPMVVWAGKMLSSVPNSEEIATVVFDAFPASQYDLSELEQASRDYIAYIKSCFDEYKHILPSQSHRRLLIIGKDTDEASAIAREMQGETEDAPPVMTSRM
mmetsp:Transcript_49823/g.131412  ORF Transcript_49823/g.131412 Transcript_49823/m.131412 type:complete len:359 (-) Transcript_49823:454-1530(-)